MATYNSSKVASTVQRRAGLDLTVAYASYTFTVAPALNDVVNMIKVPKGATVESVTVSSTDMDTNGAPAIILAVGDTGSATRFVSGASIAQGAGVVRGSNATNLPFPYTYSSEDTISIKVTTGPATGAVGTVKLAVFYTMQQ